MTDFVPPEIRAVLDGIPAMVGYWDASLHNILANNAYREYFGLGPEDIRGRHARDVLGEELFEANLPFVEEALAGREQVFEREIRDAAGATRFVRVAYVPHLTDGTVDGMIALVTDITERRVAEQARSAAEARFRLAFSASPVGMAIVEDGAIVQVNAALCSMLGWPEAELVGLALADVIADGGSERRVTRRDGSEMWAIVSVSSAVTEGDAQPIGIVQIQDISERKRVEDEVRHGRERLMEAERMAGIGSWEYDIERNRVEWSAGLFHIYGLTPDEFDPTIEGGQARVYPEDRELARQTMERAVAERSAFTIEYRAVRSDGRVRTLRNQAEVVVADDGRPVRVVGIAQDVTETRLAQEALANASADLERRALELQRHADGDPRTAPVSLTARQREIVGMVAEGLTNGQIAERLVLTEGTVKWHVKQILMKTGAANRAEAVARVFGTGRA